MLKRENENTQSEKKLSEQTDIFNKWFELYR
jgi:hypothetical protein